ncbi:MAG: hypothetical protein ACM3SO_09730 [Betaproteobacteria bacterium]
MKPLHICMILAVAAAAFAGCASPPLEPARRAQSPPAPVAAVPVERVTRYYVDETGTLWDDRGKRYDGSQ